MRLSFFSPSDAFERFPKFVRIIIIIIIIIIALNDGPKSRSGTSSDEIVPSDVVLKSET